MDITNILNAKIGSSVENGKLHVSFKKTINIRQYETEVVEASLEVPIEPADRGNRLAVIESLAFAKVEYGVMFNLLAANLITQSEFDNRKMQLVAEVETLCNYLGVDINSFN